MSELSKRYEELLALRAKAGTALPWTACFNVDAEGKRTLFPHIHLGEKKTHHVTQENERWKPKEWEGQCERYLTVNETSTGGTLEHFDDHARLIVAAVNFLDSLPALKKEWERAVMERMAVFVETHYFSWEAGKVSERVKQPDAIANAIRALARED